MVKTILIGKYIAIQGVLERILPDGRMVVRDGARLFVGRPVA